MTPATTCNYLVCATPRSGSSVICEALTATGVAGLPYEYLHDAVMEKSCVDWGVPNPAELLDRLRVLNEHARTPNGVFGMKVMTHEFGQLLRKLPTDQTLAPAEILGRRLLPGLRYIRVIRRDVLRQAVSYRRAKQTLHWSLDQAQSQAPKMQPHYDFGALVRLVRKIEELGGIWDEFFASSTLPPVTVYYEDFVADRSGTVLDLLATLRIDAPTPLFQHPMTLGRQGDALNDEWIARYHADFRHLRAGPAPAA